ncbi:MAG: PHP domain-containing protein [Candidatus Obscuribacterales bacterium]|nr:PHP domain-containing protein [Candidatus Obscuribacterales bacterium]
MSADLHLHTHYSDGNWSPQELVENAIRLGFKSIAITDHDTVAALPEARQTAAGKIRIIDGIEMNTIWYNPDGLRQDVHILGYMIDPNNAELKSAMTLQQKARTEYVHNTLELLQAKGYEVSYDDVLAAAGKGSIGRPHICAAMLKTGAIKDVNQAYRMLMNRDSEFSITRKSITPQEAIKAIHKAGGISSLAHPGKEKFIPDLLDELAKVGLKAIEAYHRGHTLSLARKYLKMAKTRNLLVTGGSDCHGPWENYPASIGTVRIAADIVQRLDDEYDRMHA